MHDDLIEALAGAVLLRDRVAEAGDQDATHLALVTVAALNRVTEELGIRTAGAAKLVREPGQPPRPTFVEE